MEANRVPAFAEEPPEKGGIENGRIAEPNGLAGGAKYCAFRGGVVDASRNIASNVSTVC